MARRQLAPGLGPMFHHDAELTGNAGTPTPTVSGADSMPRLEIRPATT